MHENEHVRKTHFHVKGFAPGLVLKQRSKGTRRWPICGTELIFICSITQWTIGKLAIWLATQAPTIDRWTALGALRAHSFSCITRISLKLSSNSRLLTSYPYTIERLSISFVFPANGKNPTFFSFAVSTRKRVVSRLSWTCELKFRFFRMDLFKKRESTVSCRLP